MTWTLALSGAILGAMIGAIAHAEPYAHIPLGEFKTMVGNVDMMKQREKLKDTLIQHLKAKDTLQTEYISKLETANEKCEALNGKLEEYTGKLEILANDPRWAERATWAGYGAAVPIAVQVIRKIVLKF